jgi:hypothetical protein
MPKSETIERFIAIVEANKHIEAVEIFYAANAIIQDNQSEIRDKEKQIENEKNMLLKIKKMDSRCIRPYFIKDDYVVIKWQFRFEFKNDTFIEIEEIAYQFWKEELIEKEQFFFDPKQFQPTPNQIINKI